MKTKLVLCTAMAGVLLAGAGVTAQTPDPAKAAAGQKLYEVSKCATCHQIKGVGGKLASKLDGVGTKLTAAELKLWLTHPAEQEAKLPAKPKMPMSTAMKKLKLSDADMDAIVAFMQLQR